MSQTTLASPSLKQSVLVVQFGPDDAACECICNIPSHRTSDGVWRQGLSVSQTWRQLAADDQIDEICPGFFMLCTKENCIWFVEIQLHDRYEIHHSWALNDLGKRFTSLRTTSIGQGSYAILFASAVVLLGLLCYIVIKISMKVQMLLKKKFNFIALFSKT